MLLVLAQCLIVFICRIPRTFLKLIVDLINKKKFELMLTRRAKANSSSGLVV